MLICHDLIILWHIIAKYFSSRNIFVLLFYDSFLGKKFSCSISTPTTWNTHFSLSCCLWHFTSLNGRNSLVWARWWSCIYSWLIWIGHRWICLLPYYTARSLTPCYQHTNTLNQAREGGKHLQWEKGGWVSFLMNLKALARRRAWALQAHNCLPRWTTINRLSSGWQEEMLFWSLSQHQSGYHCHSL